MVVVFAVSGCHSLRKANNASTRYDDLRSTCALRRPLKVPPFKTPELTARWEVTVAFRENALFSFGDSYYCVFHERHANCDATKREWNAAARSLAKSSTLPV